MSDEVYTLGVWRVKDGKQGEFVEAWKGLGRYFRSLPRTLEDIQEMRIHPDTPKEISKLMALCGEGRSGTFRVVAIG